MPRAKKAAKKEPDKRNNGKLWPKGHCPNPAGRKGLDPAISQARKLSKQRLMEAIQKVLPMPVGEVEDLAQTSSARACDVLIASVMMKGIKTGSPIHAQFFMSYTFGRPLEYDPSEEEEIEDAAERIKGLPKDIIVSILQGLQNANKQPAPIPPAT